MSDVERIKSVIKSRFMPAFWHQLDDLVEAARAEGRAEAAAKKPKRAKRNKHAGVTVAGAVES